MERKRGRERERVKRKREREREGESGRAREGGRERKRGRGDRRRKRKRERWRKREGKRKAVWGIRERHVFKYQVPDIYLWDIHNDVNNKRFPIFVGFDKKVFEWALFKCLK